MSFLFMKVYKVLHNLASHTSLNPLTILFQPLFVPYNFPLKMPSKLPTWDICTFSSLCLEYSSLKLLPGSLLRGLPVFAPASASQWSFPAILSDFLMILKHLLSSFLPYFHHRNYHLLKYHTSGFGETTLLGFVSLFLDF